ncbi:MAG TPA: ABC transporter permease [Bryobacteraceae bacterium]|nr:ABC transporter permease [Bryobacteraceae bacterium]
MFATIWQDLRYAARALSRSLGFSVAAILSLALGIGASTLVFSIADTVFLRPLPYPYPDRLLWVAIDFPTTKAEFVPSPDYVAWRRDNRVFEQLAAAQAHFGGTMILTDEQPTEVRAWGVSFNFLSTFGVNPALGRTFRPEEELPNGVKAVMLSGAFWREHFHADPQIVGRAILLDGQSYTVAGVLPSGFVFPVDVKIDMLTTLPVSPTASHHDRTMSTWAVFERLKPGVTLAEARANLETLFAASKTDEPRLFQVNNRLIVEPLQRHRVGNARSLLLILSAAVGCLLLIACTNVANLFLARWSDRSRELAVRAAIGATRSRLVRQLFTEAVLLSMFGYLAGIALVAVGQRLFVHFAARELPRLAEVSLDARVLAIALAVSVLTALFFGGLPALRAGRVDLQESFQQVGRSGIAGGGHRGLRRALVAGEIALSVVLVSGAALLLQTLWHLENDHLGFLPEHVTTITVPLRGSNLASGNREALAASLLQFIRLSPGTEAAAVTECPPLATTGPMWVTFSRSDRPLPEPFHFGDGIGVCGAGPEFFQAAGIRLIRGRFWDEKDFEHPATLAVINETAARAYFPGEDPLGKRIGHDTQDRWKTVIGIVADAKNQPNLSLAPLPEMFVNDLEWENASQLLFIVRSVADQQALVSAIRSEVHSLDPGLFVKFQTLDQAMGELSAGPRFNTVLLASFAGLAFVMSMFGVYAVLSFAVARRTSEIGIRMALGANPARVIALVMREGAVLVGIGAIAGLVGALALTRYLKTFLYDVNAADPVTYVVVLLGLSAAATLATLVPARRASSIDPMQAIRHD